MKRDRLARLMHTHLERPGPSTPRPYKFPPFVRTKLPNSVEIIIASVPRLPLVTVRVLVDAGASAEAQQHAGVAALTAGGLAEGTTSRDGAELAEAFEAQGGSLSVTAWWDGTELATTVLRDRFGSVLRLLGEVLLTPSFPEREINRLREERLAELLEIRAEPRSLADEAFEAIVFPRASRFTLPEAGSADTVRTLTRADVLRFHESQFRPSNTAVIIAGDVSPDEALREANATFGGWIGEPSPTQGVPLTVPRPGRAIHVVNRPEAPQTELRVGHAGLARPHPDYFEVVVMNAILGGVFNSRINLNLREKNAFTYGASSSFEWRRSAGPFTISTAVATDVTGRAIGELIREIERIRDAPPEEDELSLAVSYLDGVFPIRFETTEAIASALATVQTFRLPDDYHDTYRSKIRAVTAAGVQRAARDHLDPDHLQVVAVGDPARIGQELEALEMGPVGYRDPDVAVFGTA